MKADVLFVQFPGQYQTQPSAADWVAEAMSVANADPRFDRVRKTRLVGTPITALRNRACKTAIVEGFDYIVMVDSDMYPDMNGKGWPSDKKFFQSSFDFIFDKHLHAPCLIAAPYVGPPPHENIYVFLWRNKESGHPNVDWSLEGYQREEAALLGGIQRCAAIPTGVCIIDVRGLAFLPKPYFYYGYKDEDEADVVMTEDVAFSRNWGMSPALKYWLPHGMPVYCNWDAWACHWKMKMCGKPMPLKEDDVSSAYVKAAKSGVQHGEKIITLGATPFDRTPIVRGDSLVYDYSDHPNDARGMSGVIPPCTRGEFDKPDVVRKGAVIIAPENNTVAYEVARGAGVADSELSYRVPKYQTEQDLVAGKDIDYSYVKYPTDFEKVEFPSDPLAKVEKTAVAPVPAEAATDFDAVDSLHLPKSFRLGLRTGWSEK